MKLSVGVNSVVESKTLLSEIVASAIFSSVVLFGVIVVEVTVIISLIVDVVVGSTVVHFAVLDIVEVSFNVEIVDTPVLFVIGSSVFKVLDVTSKTELTLVKTQE